MPGIGEKTPRLATLADLEEAALALRSTYQPGYHYPPVYFYPDGPGVIRQSRREPVGVGRYVILGPSGRIWTITDAD